VRLMPAHLPATQAAATPQPRSCSRAQPYPASPMFPRRPVRPRRQATATKAPCSPLSTCCRASAALLAPRPLRRQLCRPLMTPSGAGNSNIASSPTTVRTVSLPEVTEAVPHAPAATAPTGAPKPGTGSQGVIADPESSTAGSAFTWTRYEQLG
jgi:hypothetical protein